MPHEPKQLEEESMMLTAEPLPGLAPLPDCASHEARYNPSVAARIVIIEDEKDIVELVRYNLRKEGLEVIGFGRGARAWTISGGTRRT